MSISRRDFCASMGLGGIGLAGLGATGLTAAGLAALPGRATAQEPPQQTLRVIAYNVYGCTGWPRDRAMAKRAVSEGQMAERTALELALYNPHIVTFSESPSEAIAKEVAERLGMNHVRFPSAGSWPGTLLTHYDVTQSENVPLGRERPSDLFTRHWGRAILTLPGGEPLIVHSAHLFPVADPTVRLKEIRAMLGAMKSDFDSGQSMLLLGDLNHTPDSEEYGLWTQAGWVDTFAQVGVGEGLTHSAIKPTIRIDYVMAAGPIAKQIVKSRPLFEGAYRLAADDERGFALSDHLPQYAEFAPDS